MTDLYIENYIPLGYEQRVSRVELQLMTGYPDRKIRKAIEDARERGILIASENGGYFKYRDARDDSHIEAYIQREEQRFRTISHQNKAMRQAWAVLHPEVPGQMSFL
jgi:hypothetical protein